VKIVSVIDPIIYLWRRLDCHGTSEQNGRTGQSVRQ
jgi:hypothetical protein